MNAIHVIMLTYRRNMARTCTDLLSISLFFGENLAYITPATSVVLEFGPLKDLIMIVTLPFSYCFIVYLSLSFDQNMSDCPLINIYIYICIDGIETLKLLTITWRRSIKCLAVQSRPKDVKTNASYIHM